MRSHLITISWISLIFTPLATASDYQSPRTAAMGGAGHASPFYTDAVYLNPSYLSQIQSTAASIGYFLPYSGSSILETQATGTTWNASFIYGSHDFPIQTGIGVTSKGSDLLGHLAVSSVLTDHFSLGIGGKLLNSQNPSGQGADFSISMSFILSDSFRLSLTADNLFENLTAPGYTREFVLGTKTSLNSQISIYLDPHLSSVSRDSSMSLGLEAGVESFLFEYFFLRAGGFIQSSNPYCAQKGSGAAAGIGLVLPQISVQYSLGSTSTAFPALAHSFGMTTYF